MKHKIHFVTYFIGGVLSSVLIWHIVNKEE